MAAVETARLYLRRLQATDLDEYYQRIYADPDVMRTLPPLGPISRAEFDTRVHTFMVEHWAVHGFGPWAVIHKPDNQFIGHCGLRYWPGSSDVEVLYALARRYWGQGLATEGARASLRYGFEHLKLERIMAAALVDNDASRRVLENIGLRYEIIFQFHGLAVAGYSFSRTDYQADDAQYRLVVSEDDPQAVMTPLKVPYTDEDLTVDVSVPDGYSIREVSDTLIRLCLEIEDALGVAILTQVSRLPHKTPEAS